MEVIPQAQDIARLGCSITSMTSPHIIDCSGQEQQPAVIPERKPAPRRARLTSRISSSLSSSLLRKSSKSSFGSSFTTNITDVIEENGDDKKNKTPSPRRAECMSAADMARLVAQEYFAEEEGQQQQEECPALESVPSPLDESCYGNKNKWQDKDCGTVTTCSESNRSTPSEADVLALEVGHSVQEYLEYCFYTEVSVLDREKFNAIPELFKSDLTIVKHLGKGSFSDVFEVVSQVEQQPSNKEKENATPADESQTGRRRASRRRRSTLSSSINVASLSRPSRHNGPVYAMKCLRPQIRSDADQFTIGAEDLVHETAILSNLDHPNIIKVHGRASGSLADAFVLNDGYFILLDKLKETLQDKIDGWKRSPKCLLQGPITKQIEVAHSISDAVEYLHSMNIIFRDLKPANVGFDSNGVLKLFDFGFATGLPEKDVDKNPEGYLFDRCGTPRYMAPEVGLSLGYGLPADVYSFGMLLWEVFAFSKPFSSVKSAEEFDSVVFIGGERPKIEPRWPDIVKELMLDCWWANPSKRPDMLEVKSILSYAMANISEEKINPMRVVRSKVTRSVAW